MTTYDATVEAARRRWEKAARLADTAWDAGLTPDQVAALDDRQLAVLARRAGVNPPRAGSVDTRALLLANLVRMTYWAAAHPEGERARRRVLSDAEVAALLASRRASASQ